MTSFPDADRPPAGFGRPSPAAAAEPRLAPAGGAGPSGWRGDGGGAGWCRLRAASVVGVRHRLAGAGSDDSYAWRLVTDLSGTARPDGAASGPAGGETLVLAVADGVGSRPGAARAARRACLAAVAGVDQELDPDAGGAPALAAPAPDPALAAPGPAAPALDPAARLARAAQWVAAGREPVGATTLVVASLGAGGDLQVARVGDSTAWVISGGAARELFPPPDPEDEGNVTAALPSGGPVQQWTGRMGPGDVLCLATDGLAGPWRDGPGTVAPALREALARPPAVPALLELVDFSRQGCHDDRTLLAVWYDGPPAAPGECPSAPCA